MGAEPRVPLVHRNSNYAPGKRISTGFCGFFGYAKHSILTEAGISLQPEVKRNLGHLIDSGLLRLAMELALELMKHGSEQVEMSDEGLMTKDIESCLNVVFEALRKTDLPAAEVMAWCSAMLKNDRVGFIARESLESLRKQLEKTAVQ